jgi:hypothetical protein
MQVIEFYDLARPAQERFVGSVNGSGLPEPILRAPSSPIAPRVWYAVSGACLVVFSMVLLVGYGSLTSSRAILGVVSLALLVVLLGVGTFGLVRAAALVREHRTSPFRRGLYLFPVGLIDARTSSLRLYPLDTLGGIYGPDVRGLTLEFEGKPFSFPVTDPALIATAKQQIELARSSLGQAAGSRESVRPKAFAALDPLQGYANPLVSSEKMVPPRASWAKLAWGIAAAVGVVVGGSLWMLRNLLSDGAMYAHAVEAADVASFQAYLEKGSRHAAEVKSTLLPRALLHEAVATGAVAAIEQFIAEQHPTGAILAEAKTALRAALLRELEVASKTGTLTALADFGRQHPGGEVAAELTTARHGVYQAALSRYTAVAPDKSPQSLAFVQHLVAWSELKGPKVELRFHTAKSRSMDKADRAAGTSRQWKGIVSLPSRYFDDAAEKSDRDALAAAITQRFADVFSPDILAFTVGDPIDPSATLPAQITVPTLFVERTSVWAGSIQASAKPRGVFIGLQMAFEATFRAPDDPRVVKVKYDVWRVPDIAAAREAEKPEETIYGAMRAKAYEQFQHKLIGTFFAAK